MRGRSGKLPAMTRAHQTRDRAADGHTSEPRPQRQKRRRMGAAPAAPPAWIWFLVVVALAWIHRLAFLFSNLDRTWGFTIFYEGDSETFYNYARALIAGQPYDSGVPFHPPGFPYVLSFAHRWVGAGSPIDSVPHQTLKIWMAAIGSLPAGLSYLLARRFLGHGVALLGAALLGYSFSSYVISIAPVSESLYCTLLLLSLLWWTHRVELPRRTDTGRPSTETSRGQVLELLEWSLLGVLLALLCLTRAEGSLIVFVVIVVSAFVHRRAPVRRWSWLLMIAGFVLAMTPWTLRNAHVLDQLNDRLSGQIAEPLPTFVPITAYGPLNFALANHEGATGEFSRSLLTSGLHEATLDLRDPQHLQYFLHGYRIGLSYLSSHPGDAVQLILKKWALYAGTLRNGYTQWNVPAGLNGVRRPVDAFVTYQPAMLWIHFAAWIIGIALAWRAGPSARRWLGVSAIPVGCGLVVTAAFFGYARLGTVLLPFIFPTIAFGLTRVAGAAVANRLPERARDRRLWLIPVALLLILELWGATGDRNYEATGTQLEGASHLNPHDTMILKVIP